jgi:hypothetical protein
MSDAVLTKLWTSASLLTLYCAFNGVADVQGSSFLLPILLEVSDERGKAAKAIFWFLLTVLPFLVSLYLAREYMARRPSLSPLQSWPVMFGFDLAVKDRLTRRYQQFWLVCLLLVPLYACGFLLVEMSKLDVVRRGYSEPAFTGVKSHLTEFRFAKDFVAIDGEAWRRLSNAGTATRDSLDLISVSYYPGFQPWAFLALYVMTLFQSWRIAVDLLLRKVANRRASNNGDR